LKRQRANSQKRLGVCAVTLALGALLSAVTASARSLDIDVVSAKGHPLSYAAVLAGWESAESAPVPLIPAVMNQQHMTFVPHMLIVPTGSPVVFPNQDKTRHHVYSFSRTKTFDIKLYIGRPERPIVFDTPGVVTLGCNIHDQMQAYIVVSDQPRWAITDEHGHARISDLPDRPVTLTIWQPWMNSEQTRVQRTVALGVNRISITLDVAPPPAPPTTSGPSLQDRFDALAH